jgi:hypothetical protein
MVGGGSRVEQKKRKKLPLNWAFVVVGTGVDPVTFRFSGGRSAN